MILGQASWDDGAHRRKSLVTPHPTDSTRVIDLHHLEAVRLAKLGEGDSRRLAEALVPPSLDAVLAGGPRAFHRIQQTLRYAHKWIGRGGFPDHLAPLRKRIRLRPCVAEPKSLRRFDGTSLDAGMIGGPEASLQHPPVPTLALVGMHPGRLAGVCLALEDAPGAVLGGWLALGPLPDGRLELLQGTDVRAFDFDLWRDLPLPDLRGGDVVLLPSPILSALPSLVPGLRFQVTAPFEKLSLRLGRGASHPTIQ